MAVATEGRYVREERIRGVQRGGRFDIGMEGSARRAIVAVEDFSGPDGSPKEVLVRAIDGIAQDAYLRGRRDLADQISDLLGHDKS